MIQFRLLVGVLLLFTSFTAFSQGYFSLRGEQYESYKNGKKSLIDEWVIITLKKGTDLYFLFEDKNYNISCVVEAKNEKTDSNGDEYMHIKCREPDQTLWNVFAYDTVIYLALHENAYYTFKNLKDYK